MKIYYMVISGHGGRVLDVTSNRNLAYSRAARWGAIVQLAVQS
jgi:hypothetical protein